MDTALGRLKTTALEDKHCMAGLRAGDAAHLDTLPSMPKILNSISNTAQRKR